jgi:hypothetical protein
MATVRIFKYPTLLLTGFLLSSVLPSPDVRAADDAPTVLEAVTSLLEENRRLVVADNMNLVPDQEDGFWTLYDEYRQSMAESENGRFVLLKEYQDSFDNLSNERAGQLLSDYLALEAQAVAVRQRYVERFNDVLDARQTLRFFQIDAKVDAIIRAEVSSGNPLAP